MRFESPLRGTRTIKELVNAARARATELGDPRVEAEHLLLGAIDLSDGAARRALLRAGADPDDAVDAVRRAHAAALRSIGIEPFTDGAARVTRRPHRTDFGESAKAVLRSAARRGQAERSREVGLHILDAIGDLQRGTAARAMRELGLAPGAVHAAVIEELALVAAE